MESNREKHPDKYINIYIYIDDSDARLLLYIYFLIKLSKIKPCNQTRSGDQVRFNHQMIIFAETTRENLRGIARSTSNFSVILTECMIQVYSRFENTRP